jgi:integrase/recombinase XerD
MTDAQLPALKASTGRLLTADQFQGLADVPPESEWFANISSAQTRRAYKAAMNDFMGFVGIEQASEFRIVTRAHVIAWRDDLKKRALGGSTIRHRLAALSSLFEYLCERNTVTHNPVKGVTRPKADSNEGKTPAIGDHQARKLLASPEGDTVKAARDRAIIATLLYHALRRDELCQLTVKDARHERRRGAFKGHWQGREDPVCAAAPGGQRIDCRLPGSGRARRRHDRPAFPSGEERPHRRAHQRDHAGRRL